MDGRVAEHFSGIGFKRLTAVECIGMGVSNQNEIGSSADMRAFLGVQRHKYTCTYFHFSDDLTETGEFTDDASWITYYDSREGSGRSPEWRLTYPAGNPVMHRARAGDYCWLLQLANDPNQLMVIVAESGTDVSRQLDRLLGTAMRHDPTPGVSGVLKLGNLADADDEELSAEDVSLLAFLGVPMD